MSSGAFYSNLQQHLRRAGLQPKGVHVLRHSTAKLRREAGQSIEELNQFLDHSSLLVTTTYLRKLKGEEDRHWQAVANTMGQSFERRDWDSQEQLAVSISCVPGCNSSAVWFLSHTRFASLPQSCRPSAGLNFLCAVVTRSTSAA